MKRWLTDLATGAYLAALLTGLASVLVRVEFGPRLLMYFLTFNMFCGWSGYEARMEIVGEGASGAFYELEPGPWGEFHPYGPMGRRHYDQEFEYGKYFVKNCLKHTVHEPIIRVYVVEVEYPKRLNLPDDQYLAYYNKPKVDQKYYHTRFILEPDGEIIAQQPVWLRYQDEICLEDNPRLLADSQRQKPFIVSKHTDVPAIFASGRFSEPPPSFRLGRPVAE